VGNALESTAVEALVSSVIERVFYD
jgi:hypothetical protein